MQPVAMESADRLTIKPAVTIGNPILEAFPEETQRRRFPNSILQKPSAYLIQITSKSKDNNSSSQYVKFDRFRNLDANCSNAEVHHPTVNQTLKRSSNESRIPKPLNLSDSLMRSLQLFQQKNISLKNFDSQSINNRDKVRKMLSGSNPDCAPKQSNTFNANATIMILAPSKKDKYVTEKNISKSKNSNIRTVIEISSKKEEYQNGNKIKRTPSKLKNNMSNKNYIDNNKAIRRSKNITVEAAKNIYEEIGTENNPLMTQKKSTDTVTQRIDNLICKFIKAKHMVCRQSDSTEVSIKPIYTTSKITTSKINDANINQNFSVTDVRNNSKILGKNQRRKHDSAYQNYYDKYLRNLITSSTMKVSTEFAVDTRTSTALKNINRHEVTWQVEKRNMLETVTEFIYSDIFNNTHGQPNLRENYIETKNNNPNNKENFFGYEIRKDSKVSNYYNKYLKRRVTPFKRTAPVTVSTTKIEEYNMMNMKYDRGQKAASSVLEEMSTANPNKNNYSSIKTEKLLYELKSPKAEIRRYFPATNVDDVDMISNLSTLNHNATQQNQSNEKYNKTHKQSNISFEKCCDENLIQSNEKIDSELINSGETPESITVESTNTISKESRKILEEKSENDFDVMLFNFTTTRVPEIVMRDANEPNAREKTSTERRGKRKHKSRHNGRKNNRPKKRKKNHAKRKRKPTASVAWKVDEPTSVDYGNAYSSDQVETLSPNDPEYNKADGNRNTSTGGNDWNFTDEITTEPFKIEFFNADESVSKHPTENSIHDEFQSEETNVNFVTNSTVSYLSTASNEKISKKCKILITTTTESNWLNWWTNDNKKTDEESTECEEDVTSLPTTSDSIEEETSYYSTSVSDYFSIYNTIFTSDSTTLFWEYSSKENKKVSDEEISTTYSMIKDEENNEKKVISKSILNEKSDKNNEGTQSWESTTYSGGTTHNVNLDLNSEEEEDGLEKSVSDEDNENDNGIEIIEDYEIDNCNKTQHACDKYTCIDEDQVCDGIVDCLNANDETECDYIYSKRWEEHQRVNNKRIDFTLNTVDDTSHLDGCNRFEHPCDSMCINALHVCDGKRDCLDGTDEENCTKGISHIANNILREASYFALCSRCKNTSS